MAAAAAANGDGAAAAAAAAAGGAGAGVNAGVGTAQMGRSEFDTGQDVGAMTQESVDYMCGACGEENKLRFGDPVRCRSCGYRVLYKKRTARMIQFSAR